MWLAEKSMAKSCEDEGGVVGVVTIGGERPSVLAEGEMRNAELLQSGAVRLPKTGDEVLLFRTADGDNIVLGRVGGDVPDGAENGECFVMNGGSCIRVKNSGEILLSGNIRLTGTVNIDGTLLINGAPYVPPATTG